jgi:nucleoside kinase
MDVLATGYPSLDSILWVSHSPVVGETALLWTLPETFSFGGCGANVAVALARLGFKAGVAMVLGDDSAGDDYVRYLTGSGIDVRNVIRLPHEKSSRSYLFLNPDGQCQNFFFPGAADAWQDHLVLDHLDQYRLALVTVGPFHYNRQFIQAVKQAGVPLAWVLRADSHAYPPDMLGDFLSASTYILMNHIEAEYVTRTLGFSAISQGLSATTRAIIVTHGSQGSQVYTAAGMTPVQAVSVGAVIDPTGAGDGFTAGFLAGILRGASPEVSARLGAVVASFVLEAVGCQTNLPDWVQATARFEDFFGPIEGVNG